MLKRNVLDSKYRKLVWFVILGISVASWVPNLIRISENKSGVNFTHFDQELALSCVLDQTGMGVDWSCDKINLKGIEEYLPSSKNWVYESNVGSIVVERTISNSTVKLVVKHPQLGKEYATYIN